MYSVHAVWSYEGQIIFRDYTHVDKAICQTGSGKEVISGDEMLTHIFPLGVTIHFQGPDCNQVINHRNLVSLEIIKER